MIREDDLPQRSRIVAIFRSLLPPNCSRGTFAFAMSCYGIALEALLTQLTMMLGLWPKKTAGVSNMADAADIQDSGAALDGGFLDLRPIEASTADFFLSPVIESAVLILVIECLRRLRAPLDVQIIAPTVLMCGLHSMNVPVWGIIVAPAFLISTYAYVHWRELSRAAGALMMIGLHFACDVLLLLQEIDRVSG